MNLTANRRDVDAEWERALPALPNDEPALCHAPLGLLDRLLGTLHAWNRRSRERAQLAEMDDARLVDIGLTRERALAESDKPFWR